MGTEVHDDAFNLPMRAFKNRPALVIATPRCVNYTTGAKEQRGEHGSNEGWQWVKQVNVILSLSPKVALMEMVANAVNYLEELRKLLSPLVKEGYVIKVVIVNMQQYGDIVNKPRLVIVAINKCLGPFAEAYNIPTGTFSDWVSYTARDIVKADKDVDKSMTLVKNDKWLRNEDNFKPGRLNMVGRSGPGQGFSSSTNANYSLDGLVPCVTTHGAGRRVREDFKPGQPIGVSYRYDVDEAAAALNLPSDYVPLVRRIQAEFEKVADKKDALVWECLGDGFSQQFAYAIGESIHKLLVVAGVEMDIVSTECEIRSGGGGRPSPVATG